MNYGLTGQIVFSNEDGVTVTVDASELEKREYENGFVELNLCGPVHEVKGRFRWNDEFRGVLVYVVEYKDGSSGVQVATDSQKQEAATNNISISEVPQ